MGPMYEFKLGAMKLDNKDRATGGKSDAYLVFKANRVRGGGLGPLEPKLSTPGGVAATGKPGKDGKDGKDKKDKKDKGKKDKKKGGGGIFGAAMKGAMAAAGATTGVGKPSCIGASDEWMMVHKTEIVYDNLNPTWKPIGVNLAMLAHNDVNQPFVIECWDWDKIGAHDFIGYVKTTVREMQSSKTLKLLNPTRKIVDGGFGKLAGQLTVNSVTQTGGPPAGGPPGAWGGAPPGGAWGPPPGGAWGPPPGGAPPGGAWGPPPGGAPPGGAWGPPPGGAPPGGAWGPPPGGRGGPPPGGQ